MTKWILQKFFGLVFDILIELKFRFFFSSSERLLKDFVNFAAKCVFLLLSYILSHEFAISVNFPLIFALSISLDFHNIFIKFANNEFKVFYLGFEFFGGSKKSLLTALTEKENKLECFLLVFIFHPSFLEISWRHLKAPDNTLRRGLQKEFKS